VAAIASDPRGALLAELDRAEAGQISDPNLLTSGEALRTAFAFRHGAGALEMAAGHDRT